MARFLRRGSTGSCQVRRLADEMQHVQDLEEDRMVLMKDIVWAFANAVSQVCVEDDGVSPCLPLVGMAKLIAAVVRAHSRKAGDVRAGQRHDCVCSGLGHW